jgi:hypothetical protein
MPPKPPKTPPKIPKAPGRRRLAPAGENPGDGDHLALVRDQLKRPRRNAAAEGEDRRGVA